MSGSDIAPKLRDVAAGMLTPFDETDTDEIRDTELAATAQWLYDGGIRLYLACANISEYHSLTQDERIETARVVCDALPEDATVLAGAGGSTKSAIELAQAHQENGADGIMVMPPDHIFKHEQGVVDYYHRLADAVDIGIVPYIRGFDATVGLLRGITAHENVVGVKWAISDIELFSECVAATDDDVVWMCGMAEPPAPAYYYEGAEGFSAGVTNFEPRLGIALFDALEAGDDDLAHELRDLSFPFMNLRAERGEDNVYAGANSVPAVKRGLELAGQYGGPVREPLVELSDADTQRADEYYEELQAGLERLDVA
ncbi:dihydrodipicolinate synthase family protein [Halobacteria archaeon AArc-m2/3/4]|uniref:Dihydrodipicolinate synthase family protein n=1 Tax=Natronoglomus mannanivorans TaxID=2979990 RepID=A0AAP2Z1W7_9EURY|nr:dihydrodipicolinate synthase family protein [Halobacteria archaeon AArc-xg1-1]MCU4975320.1 dihydrodipicolinate synthase family protein [Halobacteria archaeon AArc-m2/3/4]